MNLHEEISKTAWDLYEKSGYVTGRDMVNWLEAEMIVLSRHASQNIEEPEESAESEENGKTTPAYRREAEVTQSAADNEEIAAMEEIEKNLQPDVEKKDISRARKTPARRKPVRGSSKE